MIIIDFLIFNLANWYTSHSDKLKWSTPLERAIYVTSVITLLWLFDLWVVINTVLLKNETLKESSAFFIAFGLGVMYLYRYIYGTRGRFKRLTEADEKPFNASNKVGQLISMSLLFLPLVILGVLMLLI